jgi:NADH:ubiquinone oxidoreductase subunit 2 (subunit N)
LTLTQLLVLLLPELVLTLTALVVLGLDMIWRNGSWSQRFLLWIALIGSVILIAVTVLIWPLTGTGGLPIAFATGKDFGGDQVPMMALDPLALFFKLFTALVLILVLLASGDYVRVRIRFRGEFYALILFGGLAMMLSAAATNLLMIYLSLEFLSITSYLLTGYLREDERSTEGAVKYFVYGATASAVRIAARIFASDAPTRLPNTRPTSRRSIGSPHKLAIAFALRLLPVPCTPSSSTPLGAGNPNSRAS